MNTLTIKNLTKTYPNGVMALNDVSLTITNGLFGLLGANGAGKSSLMRTVATLQEPTSGSVSFNGIDIVSKPDDIRTHLGYLPQEFGVYPRISAERLLDHLAVLKGIVHKNDRKEQVESLLHQTNLYTHRKHAVYTFSGGMRQRFGIAQALLGDPRLIIVDEPTAGLDPEERNRFLNLLSEIGENVIVILSTHIVEDVHDLCKEMAILAQGKIIRKGNPADLVKTIAGKVWTKLVKKSAVASYHASCHVISTKLIGGDTLLTLFSESKPEQGFEMVAPKLEDLYFTSALPPQPSKTT